MTPFMVRERLSELRRQREDKDAELMALPDRGHEFRSSERGYWFVSHPSTIATGRVQLTRFDDDGPTGHTECSSYLDAARSSCGIFVDGDPPAGSMDFSPVVETS